MLFAQAQLPPQPFFPPWYFWVFVLGTVLVVFTAIVLIVYLSLQAETQRRLHERETAARLIEVLVVQRKMSAGEVEQILDSYWRLGTFWYRFSRWFKGPHSLPTKTIPSPVRL